MSAVRPDSELANLRFSAFEVNFTTRQLFKFGTRVKISDQPFEILCMLLERPGEIVSREEMRQRLWQANTYVEYDDSLNTAVRKLRAALSDSSDLPRYIETVARHGYRFVAPVHVVSEAPAKAAPAVGKEENGTATRTDPAAQRVTPRVSSHGRILALSFLLLVSLMLLLGFPRMRTAISNIFAARQVLAPGIPPIRSLAVLPLHELSHDAAEAYFADGLTDELITELGQISTLRVISRTSVMQYKGVHKPLPQIARELNVDAVVEGTVLKSGNHVRVTAQLIEAHSDKHLWAQSYQGDLRDMLGLQSQVAAAIADQIRINLTPQELASLHKDRILNPNAYQDYLRGRFLWNQRTPQALKQSIHYFRSAVSEDPEYAEAYASMASSYVLLEQYGASSNAESLPDADWAARRALQLDEMLSDAHTVLAVIHIDSEWDWAGAEAEHKRAIEANPNDATAHQWYAEFLAAKGRTSEAVSEIHKAQALDPLSVIINTVAGEIAFFARDYNSAIAECRKALAINPDFPSAHSFVGLAYTQKGDYINAEVSLRKAIAFSHHSPMSTSFLGAVYALSGRRKEAELIRDRLHQLSAKRYVSHLNFAILDSALGRKNSALMDLEKASAEHDHWLCFVGVDPRLDNLRSDPRFASLLTQIKLN
jgi:TolB-like protein/DNA-binding winged helix-turn-helix (wHTH) protein/Flp pilus assembly protein TadD